MAVKKYSVEQIIAKLREIEKGFNTWEPPSTKKVVETALGRESVGTGTRLDRVAR